MNKTHVILLTIILLFLAVSYLYVTNGRLRTSVSPQLTLSPSLSPTPSISAPIPTTLSYCLPQDVQSTVVLSPGAGNIYGTLTIKNISNKTCQIQGSTYVSAVYDTQAIKNITVTHVGSPEATTFQLVPNQTIYSQVHYPNGPQCNGTVQTAQVLFTYAISPSTSITFTNQNGKTEQSVTICTSPTSLTTIQYWNMSVKPITP